MSVKLDENQEGCNVRIISTNITFTEKAFIEFYANDWGYHKKTELELDVKRTAQIIFQTVGTMKNCEPNDIAKALNAALPELLQVVAPRHSEATLDKIVQKIKES